MKKIELQRQQTGFWPFYADKIELIDNVETSVWSVENLSILWRRRLEHLKAREALFAHLNRDDSKTPSSTEPERYHNPDLSNNEPIVAAILKELCRFVPSLPPIDYSALEEETFWKDSGAKKMLGRELCTEESTQRGKASVWISLGESSCVWQDIIRILEPLLNLLGLQLNDLVDLLNRSPCGVLKQIEIPFGLIPLSLALSFSEHLSNVDLNEELFIIPDLKTGYREGDVLKPATSL